jgi:hypothetical protein
MAPSPWVAASRRLLLETALDIMTPGAGASDPGMGAHGAYARTADMAGVTLWKNSPTIARQLPSKAFRFKWEAIEPGDVICSTIPSNPVSRLIRTLTWSDFSHVSLCVDKKGCIEANELLRVGCLNPSNVKVLRLRDDAVANAQAVGVDPTVVLPAAILEQMA